jgi:preprotein translocase subunit SecG
LTNKIQSIRSIINQKQLETASKNQQISTQASQIETIESELNNKNNLLKTRQAQITYAEKRFTYSRIIMWMLITLNIILFIFLIGLVMARYNKGVGLGETLSETTSTLTGGGFLLPSKSKSFMKSLSKYTGLKF